jgi:cytosine/adenosine deaminase-related metal-dependent hydrolase
MQVLTFATMLLVFDVAWAQTSSLQDVGEQFTGESLPETTTYVAREILTVDPTRPTAEAVAVVGDRILAVGTKAELVEAVGDQPYTVDETFADKVIVPGFIAQHDHPLLTSLTMTSEIIAIEDWVLPSGTLPAADDREDYLRR